MSGMAEIRLAAASDAQDLACIHRAAIDAAMPWLPRLHTPDEDLAFFAQRVLQEESVLVAEMGGSICGFISFAPGWVNHLYIAPDKTGHGLGSALLARAMSANSTLQLWTFQDNHKARRFYAGHGFREVELTDGRRNEERTPDVRMEWGPIP